MKYKKIKITFLILIIIGILLGSVEEKYEENWKRGIKKVDSDSVITQQHVYLEVIWDASGSMWGQEEGITKFIKSKEVLRDLTNNVPDKIKIGLRIFGARRVADLKDSFMALPFSNKKNVIFNYIENVKPLGKSPIGYSLKKAREDLSERRGQKTILLVSDGLNNDKLQPLQVAEQLKSENITLYIVHTGELNNKSLQTKLKDMAKKTGGKYYTYNNYKEIIPTLKQY